MGQDFLTSKLETLNRLAEQRSVDEVMLSALSEIGAKAVFTTSFGAEDQVITHFIAEKNLPVDLITLDTGRLFNETLDTFEKTEKKYGTIVKVLFPDPNDVEAYVNKNGINAFYNSVELRKECCRIRKIKPLERGLKGYGIWITGLRADQSENRSHMNFFEWDERFSIVKVNPLLHWQFKEVMDFVHANFVPYNLLHDQGFVSIGCAPCTRAIGEGEDFRAGRWWWESAADGKKECGLHPHGENPVAISFLRNETFGQKIL
ncbi:MAG: phosphoadenylyl-sulfate reductase [Bacteroidota bacterium]|nr:phosphoadenylyl-sulfate reductase [Bacteroidota bacterium]